MLTPQDPHMWEKSAATRQIGAHTRHYMQIIGKLGDLYAELEDLVDDTKIVPDSEYDDYMDAAMASCGIFNTEIKRLMFKHISYKLDIQGDEI